MVLFLFSFGYFFYVGSVDDGFTVAYVGGGAAALWWLQAFC